MSERTDEEAGALRSHRRTVEVRYNRESMRQACGSEGGPVTLPVFKTGDWHLRCQWCVRLAHASAKTNHLALGLRAVSVPLPFRANATTLL